jgi:hypothetical protein
MFSSPWQAGRQAFEGSGARWSYLETERASKKGFSLQITFYA